MTDRAALQRLAWIVSQLVETNTDTITVDETWQDQTITRTYMVCRFCKERAEVPLDSILHREDCTMTAITTLMSDLEGVPDHGD
jgi:hypothetical protein